MCVVDVGAIEIVKCAYLEENLYEIRVVCAELLEEKAINRASFVEPFRSKRLDDLAVLVARITARKPRV